MAFTHTFIGVVLCHILIAVGASGRHRPSVVRTHTPKPSLCGDQWRAIASAGALCYARNSTFRRVLRSAPAVDRVPRSGRSPPPLARDAGPVTGADSRAGVELFRNKRQDKLSSKKVTEEAS